MSTLTALVMWIDDHRVLASLTACAGVVALVLLALAGWLAARRLGRAARWAASRVRAAQLTPGTSLAYLAALIAMGGSAVTSWQFFGRKVGLPPSDRVFLFAVLEVSLLACSAAMRASARKATADHQRRVAGPAGAIAWALCGLSGGMALAVSGPFVGVIRVAAGPVVYLVMLHLALGIERRERRAELGVLEKVLVELRERVLSRLGLGDDQRDAAARTRDRALHRAARLAVAGRWTPARKRRLARAVRMAAVAGNPGRLDAMLDEITILKHATELGDLDRPAPWTGPHQTGPAERTSIPDRTERTASGPDRTPEADQTSPAADAEQTTTASDQTGGDPTDQPAAVVRSLRTADGLTAPQANARVLLDTYGEQIKGRKLPGNRQIRDELGWGSEKTKHALRELRTLLDQEATA